jgi:hypothetical protein
VYVALTPIGGNRDRLAASPAGTYALTQDDSVGSRCESIETRPDYETVIRPGFQRYVSYMIRRFQPRFLALSIEANIYQYLCPAAWNAMQQLLNETYDMVKLENPDLPVFHTIQADLLWQADNRDAPCFGFRRDCLIGNVERLANLKTDLYALSTYPADTYLNNGRQLPDDYLTVIGPFSGKPLAVSETGYPAITFSGQISGTCVVAQPSSPADQARWMARLLHDAQRAQMPFVVWWANEDVMPASVLAPCICEDDSVWCRFLKILDEPGRNSIRGFGTMGIRAFDATTRPARNLWKAAVTQSRNQGN